MLLSRKFKSQTLVCVHQIRAPSACLCHFPEMTRIWPLFPESPHPGGREIPMLGQAFGAGERQHL